MERVQFPVQSSVDNLNNVRSEACRNLRNKRSLETKFEEIKLTVRPKILGSFKGASLTLKGDTTLELI